LPTPNYHGIWSHVDETMQPRAACRFMVGLLHLAATQECEAELAQIVMQRIKENKTLSLTQLQAKFKQPIQSPPRIKVVQHALSHYNLLIPKCQEVSYV
jgi:hypothetical protein